MGCYHKPFASCRHTHGAIDGALRIAAKYHPDPDRIEKVEVRMYGQGVKGHDYTDIPTPTAGKMSTPFCIGLAFVRGSAGFSDFSDENVHDERIMRICRLTEVTADDAMTAMVPKKRPACVTVIMRDGTRYSEQVDYALGEPEYPMSMDDFMNKFYDLAAFGGKRYEEAARIADTILHGTGPVADLSVLLA